MSKYTNIIPRNAEELLLYRAYIVGGLRNLGVGDEDIDDRLQDIFLHCLGSNFFRLVGEKVDAGRMNARQFRAYLGATIHNVLVNGFKRDNRNPAHGAISTSVTDGDTADSHRGSINLDRHMAEEIANQTPAIPSSVVERDIIKYVAERKPAFVPTLILYLQDYRPADIARVIGKKKETIHYRMKAIFKILEEYFEAKGSPVRGNAKIRRATPLLTGPTYEVKGNSNPFSRGSGYHLWATMKACGRPVTKPELVSITQRLLDQGKFTSKRPAGEVAEGFISYAQDKDALTEHAAPAAPQSSGGRLGQGGRAKYKLTTTDNPYKWGSGEVIFDALVARTDFNFNTLLSVVQANLDANTIQSCRDAEGIAWGFIETARGYRILDRLEDEEEEATTAPVATPPVAATAPVGTTVDTTQTQDVQYRLTGTCPYHYGINFEIWTVLAEGPWTETDVYTKADALLTDGKVRSRRTSKELAYDFFYTLSREFADRCAKVN